ncbi:hypothetical protein ACTQ1Z_01395 [Parolsenella sp. LCP21S3_E11]|uniref:hypothetical protein n=1 Tax=Parolsenella sp. LCP21S3_E11 TaxID=3438797 RepID=UPI003F988219
MADLRTAALRNPAQTLNVTDDDSTDDEESLAATYDNGIEFIKDRVIQLDWEDMKRLVAGLFKSMGYCARVMPKGPDGTRSILPLTRIWWPG